MNAVEKSVFDKEVQSYEQRYTEFCENDCTVTIEGKFTKKDLNRIFNFVNDLKCSFTISRGIA